VRLFGAPRPLLQVIQSQGGWEHDSLSNTHFQRMDGWSKVWRHTQHKTGHFGDVLPSQSVSSLQPLKFGTLSLHLSVPVPVPSSTAPISPVSYAIVCFIYFDNSETNSQWARQTKLQWSAYWPKRNESRKWNTEWCKLCWQQCQWRLNRAGIYIEWSDVTESMVTIRSPFSGYNTV